MNNFFLLARQELALTLIIFILLFIKVGTKEWSNRALLNLINGLLLVNFLSGFFFYEGGVLFNEMFHTGRLLVLEKNITAGLYLAAQLWDVVFGFYTTW